MNYQHLAPYYDALVSDPEAHQAWASWVNEASQGPILDLACGTGDISLAIGRPVLGLDLSEQMVQIARRKGLEAICQDMQDLSGLPRFQTITCLCDSMNYLPDLAIFKQVAEHLEEGGRFLFDVHHMDRLKEFNQVWQETGHFEDETQYQWTIEAIDQSLYQHFSFYFSDGHMEQEDHVQRVFTPDEIEQAYLPYFVCVDRFTDFGENNELAEKDFYVLERRKTW